MDQIWTWIKTNASSTDDHQPKICSNRALLFLLIIMIVVYVISMRNVPSVSFPVSIVTVKTIQSKHQTSSTTSTVIQEKKLSAIAFHPNIAVAVEFRAIDHFVAVVHNVNYHLPSTWPIQIFHGKENQGFFYNSTLAPLIHSGKIILTSMNATFDRKQTLALLTDPKFWQKVRGEKILFFQTDSIMCSSSPHKITDYLQYDYIGAPWDPSWFTFDHQYSVGNGGFSLRTRSKTLALLALKRPPPTMPEDVWYAQNMRFVNGSIPAVEIAKTFAVESIYYERPIGIHRFPWHCKARRDLAQTCPESKLVMPEMCQ